MRKVLPFILLLILIVSCSPEEGSGKINIACAQEPVTLDVMTNSSLTGRLIASGNIYEKLLVEDVDGNIREELCSSWVKNIVNHASLNRVRDEKRQGPCELCRVQSFSSYFGCFPMYARIPPST